MGNAQGPSTIAGERQLGRRAREHGRTTQDQTFTFDVAIVGMGYVGLPTALAINASGRRVLGLDVSDARLAVIRVAAGRSSGLGQGPAEQRPAGPDLHDEQRLVVACPRGGSGCLRSHPGGPVLGARTSGFSGRRVPRWSISPVPGQLLMLTSTTYVGSTRDLLAVAVGRQGTHPGPGCVRGVLAGAHQPRRGLVLP